MSDNDLIRRMDAVQACQVGPSDEWSKSTRGGYNQAATDCAMNILRVPAVQPRMKPLVWLQHPTRLGELFADAEFGAYSVSDPTGRGCWQWQWHLMGALLDQSNQELARAFPTRGDAIAAAEGHRKARILSALEPAVQPDAAAIRGAAPRRASGPIDPEAGFATSGAEARWIADVEAGVYDDVAKSDVQAEAAHVTLQEVARDWPDYDAGLLNDWGGGNVAWWQDYIRAEIGRANDHWRALVADPPEEIGVFQARVEDQDRQIAGLTRQLQGQPRRQSDVVAGGHPTEPQIASACLSYRHDFGLLSEPQRELIMFEGLEWLRAWRREFPSLPKPVAALWQPIATAPKDRVIDIWSAEGGRCADAIWDVSWGGVEGWADANDHSSLEGYRFTHWMDRPAGPTEGGE